MARKKRMWNPRMFDHVTMRGNNRQNIFQTRGDIAAFFRTLQYTYEKYPFTIIAYCIMTNHYHLLIRSPEVPLGKVMAMINRRYANYYKGKYNYIGRLYDSRYYADMIKSPQDLLIVSRYIHRNPIETTVPMVDHLADYPYSTYPLYVKNAPPENPFLDLDLLPSYLPKGWEKTTEAYCRYCEND